METQLTLGMAIQMFNIFGSLIFLAVLIGMQGRWYWFALYGFILVGNSIGLASHFFV